MFLAWTVTNITVLIAGSVLPRTQVFSLAVSQHTRALLPWPCCVLLLLGGFVSNASFSDLSAWTLSFTSFKTSFKHHQLTFADFPLAGSLPAPLHPHILLHTKVLLMARGAVFQLLSEPLDCLNCILLFLVCQVSAVIPGGLNKFFE